MKNTATSYKSSDKKWIDESGTEIPFNRTTKAERKMERYSARILNQSLSLNKKLFELKNMIRDLSQEAHDAFMAEKNVKKKSKGNFTWYNFNRSIKIEVSVNEPILFDDLTISAAKEKLDEFLNKEIEAKNEFVKQMALDAFQTQSTGKLDTKKVLGLTRYESKINKPLFTESAKLIIEAIRRPSSKTYFRVWQKDANGKYQNVDLNLSSI